MHQKLTLILIALSILACGPSDPNEQVDEGTVQQNVYTSEEIGWTIAIPEGWDVIEMEQTQENIELGLKAMEETLGSQIDYSGMKNLIGFQKNQFNIFQSTSEPFELAYEGEWEEHNAALKEILYTTYLNQGIRPDSTATSTEVIDGLEFQKFGFTIFTPTGDVLLNQIVYSRLINGLDFGVNLNYNNEQAKEEMLKAWKNSKFKHN